MLAASLSTAARPRPTALAGVQVAAAATPVFEIIDSLEGLRRLETDWTQLFDRAAMPHQVFQSHGFALAWARTWLAPAASAAASRRLAILTGRRNGRLVLVWPLVVDRVAGLRHLSWLGLPVAQYGDVLIEPSSDAADVLRVAWTAILTQLRPDVVRLRKVRADAAIAPLLAQIGTTKVFPQQAPFVRLGPGSTASFDERQSGKARKNRRRLFRRLQEMGTVSFQCIPCSAEAADIALTGLAFKRRWLTARGLYSSAFVGHALERFFELAAADRTNATGCRVYALTLSGVPLAVAVGFLAGRTLALHLISYDTSHEKLGVGVLSIEALLRHAEAEGLQQVDLLAPNSDYKMTWTSNAVDIADHIVPVTRAGAVWSGLVEARLLPAAKWALETAVPAVRRRLAAAAPAARARLSRGPGT